MRTFRGFGVNPFRYDSAKDFTVPVIFAAIISLCWILVASFTQPVLFDHALMPLSVTRLPDKTMWVEMPRSI